MRAILLGCGGSAGVPMANGDWGACDPAEPRNRRSRPSLLVEWPGHRILVDTGPDLREQLARTGSGHVDAIVYTHAHADHTHGIDDVRTINWTMGRPVPAFGTAETLASIAERFAYAFRPFDPARGLIRPHLEPTPITAPGFTIGDLVVRCGEHEHGRRTATSLRFGRLAYSTDIKELPEDAEALLSGLDVWIVGCVRREPHPTHAHLEQVLDWVARFRPRRTILTHMNHSLDYASLIAELPPGVEPGHDGMLIGVG